MGTSLGDQLHQLAIPSHHVVLDLVGRDFCKEISAHSILLSSIRALGQLPVKGVDALFQSRFGIHEAWVLGLQQLHQVLTLACFEKLGIPGLT